MEQQFSINSLEDLKSLLESREESLKGFVSEAIESEFDLLEFDLFISSIGKESLDASTREVKKLRKKLDEKKMDLSKYEEMTNDF